MKQDQVQIGGRYLTYIGQTLAPVVVVSRVEGDPSSLFSRRVTFVVRRFDKSSEREPIDRSRFFPSLPY